MDPDQTIFWANETALAMHGVEKLAELGATVTEYRERFELQYRNNHKLLPGDYPMDCVVAGEEFSDVIVEVTRAGRPEQQWVHRIRSLVLTDTAGDPDCLVLVLHDVTEGFSAEERFERTFNADPAPAIICRLSDLRYIKVNLGFQEMTGYKRDDVIGRSVYEIDVLEGAERREFAIERLNEARTIPQLEAELRLPGGGSKYVIVAGQPIDIGDESCMLFYVHGPGAAQEGRGGAPAKRGEVLEVLPADAGADDHQHDAGLPDPRCERRPRSRDRLFG